MTFTKTPFYFRDGKVKILENKAEPHEVLSAIFKLKPLPNTLKVPKRKFEKGILGWNSKIRIIEQYSNCYCKIICKLKV